MADPFTLSIVSLGLGVGGSMSKWFGTHAQADAVREQTAEQVRRQRGEQQQRMGQAEVAAGASGAEFSSSSLQQHLTDMRTEMQRQLLWTQRAGTRQADSMETAAPLNFLSDVGGSLFSFGAANNWWRKTPGGEA